MLTAVLLVWGARVTCPICKRNSARRSRRHSVADYVLGIVGVYPWRCSDCHSRFFARLMPLSESLRAHCPICGNLDLKRISAEHVDSRFSFVWRVLRIPAYRCEPCRYKYFSVRPQRRSTAELHHYSSAG